MEAGMKSGAGPDAGAALDVSLETEPDRQTPARLLAMTSRLLNQTSAHAQRLVGEGLAEADARKYHFALLAALDEFGPASQASLSERTGIYRSDIVATINELTDRGFVDRAPDPADRRRNVITMAPAGLDHLHRLDVLLGAVQEELLAPLSPDERAELTRLLRRLLDHHGGAWHKPAGEMP
jgi:DNA-binding MarR family transcriptional regulator